MEENKTTLVLETAHLYITDSHLEKRDYDGRIIARHSLPLIREIKIVRKINWFTIAFCLMFSALAYVTKTYMESVLWGSVAGIVLLFLAVFSLLFFWDYELALITEEGSARYELWNENNEGFAASLREIVAAKKKRLPDNPDRSL